MKRILSLVLICLMCLDFLPYQAPAAQAAQGPELPIIITPVNPELTDYLSKQSSPGIQSFNMDDNETPNGIIPPPVVYTQTPGNIVYAPSTANAKYDPRVDSNATITSVKDQQSLGVCWAFAGLGALESYIKYKQGSNTDWSENHLRHAVSNNGGNTLGFVRSNDGGGNADMVAAYYMRQSIGGPVSETSDPYVNNATARAAADTAAKSRVGKVTGMVWIPDLTSGTAGTTPVYRNQIKQAIQDYGAVAISYYSTGSTSSSGQSGPSYYTAENQINHGVVIVGWDDTYAASSFSPQPSGSGAWLCKNSWGSSWGDGSGYFWMSYYTPIKSVNAVTGYAATFSNGTFDYAPFGQTATAGYGNSVSTLYYGNVFDCTDAGAQLKQVTFLNPNANTNYSVYIYASSGESDSVMLTKTVSSTAVATGTTTHPGYYTVDVSPVAVANKSFAVVVKVSGGSDLKAPLETTVSGYCTATTKTGQSFMGYTGSSWSDTGGSGGNIDVKAIVSGSAGGTDLTRNPPAQAANIDLTSVEIDHAQSYVLSTATINEGATGVRYEWYLYDFETTNIANVRQGTSNKPLSSEATCRLPYVSDGKWLYVIVTQPPESTAGGHKIIELMTGKKVTQTGITLTPLPKVTNLVLTGNVLTWDAVPNASYYKIDMSDTTKVLTFNGTFNGASFTFSTPLLPNYAMAVTAIGDGIAYSDGPRSDGLIIPVPKYNLTSVVLDSPVKIGKSAQPRLTPKATTEDEYRKYKLRWFVLDDGNVTNVSGYDPISPHSITAYIVWNEAFIGKYLYVEVTQYATDTVDGTVDIVILSNGAIIEEPEPDDPEDSNGDPDNPAELGTPAETVTVPSNTTGATINLTDETITLPDGFSVAAYSLDGGTKWKKGALPNGEKFKKLLDKGMTLWLSDGWNAKDLKEDKKVLEKKGVPANATIIKFPKINSRPKANTEKLAPFYPSSNDDIWVLAKKSDASGMAVSTGYEYAGTSNGKTPNDTGWLEVSKGGFDLKSGKTKTTYLVRSGPISSGNTYTPASKPFKVKPANFGKVPGYKIKQVKDPEDKTKRIKLVVLKKGDAYAVDSSAYTTVLDKEELKIDDLAKKGSVLEIKKAATGKKPRSEVQEISLPD